MTVKQHNFYFHVIDMNITCKEFAPDVFAALRRFDSFEDFDIKQSLSVQANNKQIVSAGEGMGKSGSFFFKCHNENFLIKTMTNNDFKCFKSQELIC